MEQDKKKNENMLNTDKVGSLLLKLSLPAFVGMFVMTLYNAVDTIFIGHFVGSLGIAALSIVFPVQMLTMGIGQMMGMGGASLISRLIGAGDEKKADKALGNAIAGTMIGSAIIMVIGLTATDFCLHYLGASDTILPYARVYMQIIVIGMFFQTLAMAMTNLVRSEGNSKVPMFGMMIGALTNILLDAIFIIPLHMGIAGAALATIIGQFLSTLYFATYYISGKSYLKFHFKDLIIQWDIMKQILAIGVAGFAMSVSGSISAIFVNRLCVQYGGDVAVSAYGIANRIIMFALMPAIVIAQGLQPIIGYNYGAKNFRRLLRTVKLGLGFATLFCLISFAAIFSFPQIIVQVFTTEKALVELAAHATKYVFAASFLIGGIVVGSITFQSIGKATESFITSMSRATLFLIPLIMILPRFIGLDGLWISFALSDLFTFVLVMIMLFPQVRNFRKEALAQESA